MLAEALGFLKNIILRVFYTPRIKFPLTDAPEYIFHASPSWFVIPRRQPLTPVPCKDRPQLQSQVGRSEDLRTWHGGVDTRGRARTASLPVGAEQYMYLVTPVCESHMVVCGGCVAVKGTRRVFILASTLFSSHDVGEFEVV